MPITHFGDPRIGLVQAYRNILDAEILAKRNNPNFIPYAKIYVYKANLKNDFPVQVEDHGAPNAMALLNCLRSRNSLRPNGKNLITDQEFYDFQYKDFDLRATRDLGERATLPGRKRAAEIIRSHNCDIVTYENTDTGEINGINIFSNFFKTKFDFVPDGEEKQCYISLEETEATLLFEIDRTDIDKICKDNNFDVFSF